MRNPHNSIMERNYVVEAILVLLGVAAIVTAIKYPKDVFVKLPMEILKFPFRLAGDIITFPLLILGWTTIYLCERCRWKTSPGIVKFIKKVTRK